MAGEVLVFDEAIDIWKALTERLRRISAEAAGEGRPFTVALSGGRTPVGFYCYLGRQEGLSWSDTHIFQVDERFVPAGSEDSNFRMISSSLLKGTTVLPAGVHPIATDEPSAAGAAARYEEELRTFFERPDGEWPRFDLVLLGIGEDGHTASLFPGTPAVSEKRAWTSAVVPVQVGFERITLTLPVINSARNVVFVVTGQGKAGVLGKVLEGDRSLPAAMVEPEGGDLTFFLDRKAGGVHDRQK